MLCRSDPAGRGYGIGYHMYSGFSRQGRLALKLEQVCDLLQTFGSRYKLRPTMEELN